MFEAKLIAEYFVSKSVLEGQPITHMKLQKLIYFAHGMRLAEKGEPLVMNSFEAWEYGPVIRDIYTRYKKYGGQPINLLITKVPVLKIELKTFLDKIFNKYRSYPAPILSRDTHQIGGPWDIAKKANPTKRNPVISNKSIKDYFLTLV